MGDNISTWRQRACIAAVREHWTVVFNNGLVTITLLYCSENIENTLS